MSLGKLTRTLALRRSKCPTALHLRQLREQLEQTPTGGGELLAISFGEWCRQLKIKSDKGLVPFELFPWQESFADLITGDQALTRRTITLLSSRQTGKTSLILALGAYLAQSRAQFTAVYIHRTTADAHLLARRLKRFLDGVEMTSDSLSLLEFKKSGSMIHFRSSNPAKSDGSEQVGRGLENVDFCCFDESSFQQNLKDSLGVIAPALTWSDMGLVVFVGTASSKTSYYYETLSNAAGGDQELDDVLYSVRAGDLPPFQLLDRGEGPVGVITHWKAIERFANEPDFEGRVQKEFDLSDDQMASEYSLKFGEAGDASVFDFAMVQAATRGSFAEEANRSRVYFAGIDPAGVGNDYTVAIVLEQLKSGGFQVSQMYRRRKGTSELHLSNISRMLQDHDPISTMVETNSIGQLYLENLSSVNKTLFIQGFCTTQSSKELLVGRINLALESGELSIPRSAISAELLTFRRTGLSGQKLEAAQGAHDDCVIALGLALTAAKYGKHL